MISAPCGNLRSEQKTCFVAFLTCNRVRENGPKFFATRLRDHKRPETLLGRFPTRPAPQSDETLGDSLSGLTIRLPNRGDAQHGDVWRVDPRRAGFATRAKFSHETFGREGNPSSFHVTGDA
jgi:hypothetical protein